MGEGPDWKGLAARLRPTFRLVGRILAWPFRAIDRLALWIAANKDRFIVYGALLALISFGYGYLDKRYDTRLGNSIQLAQELTSPAIINLRSDYSQKLLTPDNDDYFKSKEKIDSDFEEHVFSQYSKDAAYMKLFYTFHELYNHLAWCAASGWCDPQSVCVLTWRDIQDFHYTNLRLYEHWNEVSHFTNDYAMQQLDVICDAKNVVFERDDDGLVCKIAIAIRGLLNLYPGNECRRKTPPATQAAITP